MSTVLITGANRGLGLGFCKAFLERNDKVIATCRSPEQAQTLHDWVDNHENMVLWPLDITCATDINALVAKLEGEAIDRLVLNAGISGQRGVSLGNIDPENMSEVFAVNTIAPMVLLDALLENVQASEEKCVAVISSKMGSISDNAKGKSYAYRSSKAALNAMMYSASIDMAPLGVKLLLLHPGWVETDMGGKNALIDVQTSVSGMLNVMDNHAQYQSGAFVDFAGKPIAW